MVIVQQTTDSRVHLVSQFLPNVWAVYIFFSHNNAVKFGEFLTVFSDWNHENFLVFPVLCPVLCLSAGFIEGQVSGHIKAFSAVSRLEKGVFLKGYPLHGFPGGGSGRVGTTMRWFHLISGAQAAKVFFLHQNYHKVCPFPRIVQTLGRMAPIFFFKKNPSRTPNKTNISRCIPQDFCFPPFFSSFLG